MPFYVISHQEENHILCDNTISGYSKMMLFYSCRKFNYCVKKLYVDSYLNFQKRCENTILRKSFFMWFYHCGCNMKIAKLTAKIMWFCRGCRFRYKWLHIKSAVFGVTHMWRLKFCTVCRSDSFSRRACAFNRPSMHSSYLPKCGFIVNTDSKSFLGMS